MQIWKKNNGREVTKVVLEYTNALFLLPNGTYGNANEAGNYVIGFAYGFAGIKSSAADKANLYRQYMEGKEDEEWEQRVLRYSQVHGLYIRESIFKKYVK